MRFNQFVILLICLSVSLSFGGRRVKDPCKCMDIEDDGFGGIKKIGYRLIKCPNKSIGMLIGLIEEDGNKYLRVFVRVHEANYETLTKRKLKISFYEGKEFMELEMSSDTKPSVKVHQYGASTEWKIDLPVNNNILEELYTRKIKAIQYLHYNQKATGKISERAVEDINKMISCLLTSASTEKSN